MEAVGGTQKGKVTLVAVFYNEEKKLPGYFRNVEGVFDDVIVVDCSSTDATAEICRKNKATVLSSGYRYFEQNVNAALARVKTEYVFVLDADERLSDGLKREIRESAASAKFDRYYMHRFNYIFGSFAKHEVRNIWLPRLFRLGHVRWVREEPHETSLMTGTLTRLSSPMYHYANPSTVYWLKKTADYLDTMPREYAKKGQKKVNLGERVGAIAIVFGSHGWRRLVLFPVFQVFNYLFRHRLVLDGSAGITFSCCQGVYAFIEEAIHQEAARKEKTGAKFDWANEYPEK